MDALGRELSRLSKAPRLSSAVEDVDQIIALLSQARDQVAEALDPHTAGLTMAKLQNPIREGFEAVNQDLREVSKSQRNLGKALDKALPLKALPTTHDAMAEHEELINRAIAMHLLREGQFSVASTFIAEAQEKSARQPPSSSSATAPSPGDAAHPHRSSDDHDAAGPGGGGGGGGGGGLSSLHSEELQARFSEMYSILQELRGRNLVPAIEWARANSDELEARGSNLEFELSKLQYVWLFQGSPVHGLPADDDDGGGGGDGRNGRERALLYARRHFARFQHRHLPEIQRLASAMAFAPDIASSPYRDLVSTDAAFADVASSFTREFCSLLGLSAESPLYVAATAGALALPQLVKYTSAIRAKGTEWTTANELAFETPLPRRMIYHSIFVCPVSKEQTTEANPPMRIPCGHVLARETLQKLCKGNSFKCPYCPSEGHMRDAREIVL